MSINYHAIILDLVSWASAAKLVAGGAIHKAWSAFVGAEKKAKAELAKFEGEAKVEIKKL